MTQPAPPKQSGPKQSVDSAAPRRNRPAEIGADATFAAAAAFRRAGFSDPTLVLRWDEIAGAELARIARPQRLADGVLTLRAEPGAALFLGHEQRALLSRINTYLGGPVVTRIKFIQARLSLRPSPTPPPRPAATAKPDDPAHAYKGPERLGLALQDLARWRAGNKTRRD